MQDIPQRTVTRCTDIQHTLVFLHPGTTRSSSRNMSTKYVVCIAAYRRDSHLHDKPEGRCLWRARYEPWNDISRWWACSLLLPVLLCLSAPFVIFLVLNIGCGLCKCQGQASPLFGQLSKALFRSTENALVRYQSALKGFRSSCGGLGGHQMAR